MSRTVTRPKVMAAAMLTIIPTALGVAPAGASARARAEGQAFTAQVFAAGAGITHTTPKGAETVSQPDDITSLSGKIFVAFQNGVGPQGQAASNGNRVSTIVEFDASGRPVVHWDIEGKCDGLTADPLTGEVIATVNEDANSGIYTINPKEGKLTHYHYASNLGSMGGTDAISVYNGLVLTSASAPGTTGEPAPQASYPAIYQVTFDATNRSASIHPGFSDEASATVANLDSPDHGKNVQLALTDPDSSSVVPQFASRFAGDFMLTSQGDKEQVFVAGLGTSSESLSVLRLSTSVDDTTWAGASGAIYTTDHDNNTVYKVTGPFRQGEVFVAATPCDANNAPSTCPGPDFPPNYLGELNPGTGVVARVALGGAPVEPQGMIFVS